MTNMALFAEQQVRADLARLLLAAVEASGRARCDIARDAQIHKDALRRVLAGERSASLGEALRVLAACGVAPHAHLLLFLVESPEQFLDLPQRCVFVGSGLVPAQIGHGLEVLVAVTASFLGGEVSDLLADLVQRDRCQKRQQVLTVTQMEFVLAGTSEERPKGRLHEVVGVDATLHSIREIPLGQASQAFLVADPEIGNGAVVVVAKSSDPALAFVGHDRQGFAG